LDEIFRIELSGGNGLYAELALPATDYEMLDALERLSMDPGQNPNWEITCHSGYEHIDLFLREGTVYELNALARKLSEMDATQKTAFEGLIQIALNRREGPMSFADLMAYANSVDGCQVIHGATDDAALGRFYAEYGFAPEVDDLPDNIFELLDFRKIGNVMRAGERGAFTRNGYVLQSDELKPAPENYAAIPQKPSYILSLLVARYPFETGGAPEMTTTLELPATKQEQVRVLEQIGAASWDEVIFQLKDSAIPHFKDSLSNVYSVAQLSEFADAVKQIDDLGQLTKLKAVICAMDDVEVDTVLEVIQNLDDYIIEGDKHFPEDVAREEIRFSLSEAEANILIKHVDLYAYGKELMEHYNYELTDYGLISRRDGQQILQPEENAPQMTM